MSNVNINLPAPAGNGSGAWTDVSAIGFEKTIIVGNLPNAVLHIEMSNEAVATKAAPVAVIASPGQKIVGCAALWMRVTVLGYASGGAPVVYVNGNDDGAVGTAFVVPAGSGAGAAVDVSAFGEVRTFTVGNTFTGNLLIEGSDDNVNWASFLGFTGPGEKSFTFGSKYVRVKRQGVSAGATPIVNMAAINDVTPGPGFLNPVIFSYTVTGAEPDLSDFMVPLPAARLDDAYLPLFTGGGMVNEVTCDCPNGLAGDRTLVAFRAIFSAVLTAGDVLTFLVANP